jgi:hypothetical protein
MKCHLLVTPYEHSRQENKVKETRSRSLKPNNPNGHCSLGGIKTMKQNRKEFESKELEAEREYQKKLEKLASEAPLFKDDDRL